MLSSKLVIFCYKTKCLRVAKSNIVGPEEDMIQDF